MITAKPPSERAPSFTEHVGKLVFGRPAAWVFLIVVLPATVTGCIHPPRAAVSMRMTRHAKTPSDASVTIDEEYIGPLGYVVARGVRLPLGQHRITVERDGYFPFDTVVTAGRDPVRLEIELVPIPD